MRITFNIYSNMSFLVSYVDLYLKFDSTIIYGRTWCIILCLFFNESVMADNINNMQKIVLNICFDFYLPYRDLWKSCYCCTINLKTNGVNKIYLFCVTKELSIGNMNLNHDQYTGEQMSANQQPICSSILLMSYEPGIHLSLSMTHYPEKHWVRMHTLSYYYPGSLYLKKKKENN